MQESLKSPDNTIATVAVLVSDGFDGASYSALVSALAEHRAEAKVVATHLGTITNNKGEELQADFSLANASLVPFDAVFVPGGQSSVDELSKEANALRLISDGFHHSKTVGLAGEARSLLETSGILRELGPNVAPNILTTDKTLSIDKLILGSDGLELSQTFVDALEHNIPPQDFA